MSACHINILNETAYFINVRWNCEHLWQRGCVCVCTHTHANSRESGTSGDSYAIETRIRTAAVTWQLILLSVRKCPMWLSPGHTATDVGAVLRTRRALLSYFSKKPFLLNYIHPIAFVIWNRKPSSHVKHSGARYVRTLASRLQKLREAQSRMRCRARVPSLCYQYDTQNPKPNVPRHL